MNLLALLVDACTCITVSSVVVAGDGLFCSVILVFFISWNVIPWSGYFNRERKCPDTQCWLPRSWPFPVLEYKNISRIKYTETIRVYFKNKLVALSIIIFETLLSSNVDRILIRGVNALLPPEAKILKI